MFSPTAGMLADISLKLWMCCFKMGIVASVRVSYEPRGQSLSRYLKTENFIIRMSDHEHRNTSPFDGQVIVKAGDDPAAKLDEAMKLLQTLLVGKQAAAA